MIISLNWLKQFVDIDISIDELKDLVGSRLVEIEDVEYLGEKYKDVIIAKVIECEKIEGSDHLSLVKIDDGRKCTFVERDSNGFVQVVCGAPNIKSGLTVAWLPPESIVPETFSSNEPFKLGIKNLRGHISNGMIASMKELDISDSHEGILEIYDNLSAGTSFSDYLELDDYLLNIENKSLTHRPDCFGIVGFAREVAAILGKQFKTPDWLINYSNEVSPKNEKLDLSIEISNPELCSRYLASAMKINSNKLNSPLKIQTYLSRVGIRPISPIVDVTNYLMILTGQPIHAFDYDKVLSIGGENIPKIVVRGGVEGEKLQLLDGKTIEPVDGDIIIAANTTAIGLAGAMGGANSEIDQNTKRIIIESASFNLFNLRTTQMRHGIFSEAITRFTKGQSPELSAPVMKMALNLMSEWAGAELVSEIVDIYPVRFEKKQIKISRESIVKNLGFDVSSSLIVETLKNAEFDVEESDDNFLVQAPYWRSDIHIEEDIIEEVGRLVGFDNIRPTLPHRDFVAVGPSEFDEFKSRIKKILISCGANEILSYSFIHGDIIRKSMQNTDNSYKLINSISPDLQYYRQTLTPSLLNMINPNIKQGFDEFSLFELNKVHQKKFGLNDEDVPSEADMLALVYASKQNKSGSAYYYLKNIISFVAKKIGINIDFATLSDDVDSALAAPFEMKRSAVVVDQTSGITIGVIGEYKKSVEKSFKLPEYCSGFEIDMRNLFEISKKSTKSYSPLSRFPSIERDICFQVNSDTNFSKLEKTAKLSLQSLPYETEIIPVDIYQSSKNERKNITLRIKIVSHDHTLTSDEANGVIDSVKLSVMAETGASVI